MINRIVVLGGGSAGFLAALTLRRRLPQVAVTVLHSSALGIIGVGEGSTPALTLHLHGYLEIDLAEFYRRAEPSWKLGIKFLWGKRPSFHYNFKPQFDTKYRILQHMTGYYCEKDCSAVEISSALMEQDLVSVRVENGGPYIGNDLAYHLENETFVSYLESLSKQWGVTLIDDTIASVDHTGEQVHALIGKDGTRYEADLFVDCSGFRSELLGQTLNEPYVSFADQLLCDRAVVGGWARTTEVIKPYTTAEAMESGWCWQIEHERRINRGYVYSSRFISNADAEAEFRSKNPSVGKTRVVPFKSGCYQRSWVGNVVAIGNAAGFVEPLEATALGVICGDTQSLAESLRDSGRMPGPALVREYNQRTWAVWSTIRDFLAVHYKFNSQFDTPFWETCRREIPLKGAERIVEYFQEQGPSGLWRKTLINAQDIFDVDGYLTMLIGMQVPYQYHPEISAEEAQTFAKIQNVFRNRAASGMNVAEAMSIVRSPHWNWDLDFYRNWYAQQSKV